MPIIRTYKYRIKSTGDSSAKFGPCEVCGKHASEVFYQVEERKYTRYDDSTGWTRYECRDFFGHEKCLRGQRR